MAMGVPPIAGWFTMENTTKKWMMAGGTPIYGIPMPENPPCHVPFSEAAYVFLSRGRRGDHTCAKDQEKKKRINHLVD